MIIASTPFRMSFFGGGTDYPAFYEKYGGSVISTTFDKFCNAIVRQLPPFFDYKIHVSYRIVEKAAELNKIEHPTVREAMRHLGMEDLYIAYDADLPARSGLGSSSAFAVSLLHAFYALKGQYADKKRLATDAIYVERVLCRESGGIQDQIAVAFGGFNRIDFSADDFTVKPLIIPQARKARLNKNLMLFFTGFARYSGRIASMQEKSIEAKTAELKEMLALVDEAEHVLTGNGDLNEFGRLLDYTWQLKRGLTNLVSTDSIDACYARAKAAGAIGGKLLGAGGGGFMVFYVEPERQPAVAEALKDLLYIPFEFEDEGTRILYYKPARFNVSLPKFGQNEGAENG